MPEIDQYKAQISADVSRFVKAIDTAITEIARVSEESGVASVALDKLEKTFVGVSASAKSMQASLAGNTKALKSQTAAATAAQAAVARLNDASKGNGKNSGLQVFDSSINARLAQATAEYKKYGEARDAATSGFGDTAALKSEEQAREQVMRSLKEDILMRNADAVAAGKQAVAQKEVATAAAREAAALAAVRAANAGDNTQLAAMRGTADYGKVLESSVEGLANQRYALYDVAATLGTVSAVLAVLPAGAAIAGASFEQAFANVARTTGETGDQLSDLRASLVDISNTMPTAFGDVTQIATLAAQLGIANDNVAGFTKTVSQFSATTDVSIDAAATGFGRLAQLTKTPQDQISNLANSIYQVGINSVATESDVLSMAQELATSGNLAGFTQQQVVGLAGALASLGVAPEQARSAVMRIFGQITDAVGEGGAALGNFAKTSGETASAFASQWKSDPQQAFSAYLAGLHKIQAETKNANGALQDQGFANVRDRNVLIRLAQNMDVYNQTLDDSASAYQNNTALADGYAIATDTLQAKLSVLANNIKSLFDAASNNAPLKAVVDLFTGMIQAAQAIINNPVGKVISAIVLSVLALGAALAAGLAGFLLYRASLLAVSTALSNAAKNSAATTLSIAALNKELISASLAGTKFGAAMASAGAGNTAASISSTGAAVERTATGLRAGSIAATGFGIALKGALISSGIGIALVAIPTLINAIGDAFKSNGAKAKDYFGDVSGLGEAIAKDTAAAANGASSFGSLNVQVSASKDTLAGWATDLSTASGAQVALGKNTKDTTDKVTTQTAALGNSTKAWLASTLANNANFQKTWEKNGDAIKAAGFDLKAFFAAALAKPGQGGEQYLDGLIKKYQTFIDQVATKATQLQPVSAADQAQAQQYQANIKALQKLQEVVQSTDGEFDNFKDKQELVAAVSEATGVQLDTQGQQFEQDGGSAKDAADKLQGYIDAQFGAQNALVATNDALYQLGQGLQSNGLDFSAVTDAGRQNLGNLQGAISALAQQANGDAGVFAQSVISLISSLQSQGVDTQNQLGSLFSLLNQLVGKQYNINFSTAAARTNVAKFVQDASTDLSNLEAQFEGLASTAASLKSAANTGIGWLDTALNAAGGAFQYAASGVQDNMNAIKQFGIQTANNADQTVQDTQQVKQGYNDAAVAANKTAGGADKAAKSTKKLADNATKAAKEVRTLVDYGNDLSSVFNRDFEIRFGNQDAKDDTADQFQQMLDDRAALKQTVTEDKADIADLKQQWKDAASDVKKYQQQVNGLKSSNKVLEYQLKVARQYGDTVRANAIQAEIASNNADIADATKNKSDAQKDETDITKKLGVAQKKLTDDQKKVKAGLKGNTQQARDNRQSMEDLTQSYLDQLSEMARNGASQHDLKVKAGEFATALENQGKKLGYTKDQITPYTDALDDVPDIVNKIPRDITTSVNAKTNPASTAIDEFIKKYNNKKTVNVAVKAKNPPATTAYNGGKSAGTHYTSGFNKRKTPAAKLPNDGSTPGKSHGLAYGKGWVYQVDQQRKIYITKDKSIPGGKKYHTQNGPYFFNKGGQVPNYLASGGSPSAHPGRARGSDTIPAWLTPGEFVLRKSTVSALGLPYLNALNRMQTPIYRASGGGTGSASVSGGGITLVEILPSQVRQIAKAVSTVLSIDGKVVAKATNDNNRNQAIRGAN